MQTRIDLITISLKLTRNSMSVMSIKRYQEPGYSQHYAIHCHTVQKAW